jgi:tetratricopeptide (TPR) repeat protein
MKDELKKRIEDEINNNRIWKAKEILQGMIRSQPYDEEVYYQYAKILYKLGDFVESGKYFLLSDASNEDYKKAIDEFLKRYDEQNYFSHFPRMFKKVPIDNYPKNLKNLMAEKPAIQRYIKEYQKYQNNNQNEYKEDFIDKAMGIFIGFIVLLIISIFLLGAGVLIKYLWSLL